MTTWKPDPQTYDQALHEIGCLEALVADLQEQLAEAHRQIAALTSAQASDMPPNNRIYEPCKVDHVPRDQKTR